MSRVRLGIAFLVSVAIGGAIGSATVAVASPRGPVTHVTAKPPCPCVKCKDGSSQATSCEFGPGETCYLRYPDPNDPPGTATCISGTCSPGSHCF